MICMCLRTEHLLVSLDQFVSQVPFLLMCDFSFTNLQISSRNLDRVRKLKSAMTRLTSRVQKVCLSFSSTCYILKHTRCSGLCVRLWTNDMVSKRKKMSSSRAECFVNLI